MTRPCAPEIGLTQSMDYIAIARRWIATVLAAVLGAAVDVIETILPSQPRWLAQIRALALQLRAAEQQGATANVARTTRGEGPAGPSEHATDLAALLESHTLLQRSLLDFEARGLGLDPVLLDRMASDWTPASIVSYLQSCEQQVRQRSTEALAVASAPFGGGPAGPHSASDGARRGGKSGAAASQAD